MTETGREIPESCRTARESYGLSLADPAAPVDASAQSHLAGCAACQEASRRMRRAFEGAGALKTAPLSGAEMDRLFQGSIARARAGDREEAALRRGRAAGFGWGFLLATAAALAFLALHPGGLTTTPSTPVAIAPTPTAPPAEPPEVTLINAKGEVSDVPADGSTLETPVAGTRLPLGLFSASKGAALSVEGAGLLAVRGDTAIVIGGVKGNPELAVARGEVYLDLPKGTIHTFVVRTPSGAVHVTGTQFDVKAGAKSTTVKVTRGSVKVVSAQGETAVSEGESATVGEGAGSLSGLLAAPASDLDWVRELAPDRAPLPFRPGSPAAHPTPQVAAAEQEETVSRPGLDKTIIDDAMQKRQDALRYCYEKALRSDPTLAVHAVLSFRVDDHGVPEGLRIRGLEAGQSELKDCLTEAARKAVFPPAVRGTEVAVTYPIDFVPPPQ